MNQRFLVNKVIALLSFVQTQVVVSFRFDQFTSLSYLCFCGDSNLSLKCLYFSFLSLMMRICALIEIEFFFLCHDLKVLEVIHNFWSIIDGNNLLY